MKRYRRTCQKNTSTYRSHLITLVNRIKYRLFSLDGFGFFFFLEQIQTPVRFTWVLSVLVSRKKDKLRYQYPQGESYLDVIQRMKKMRRKVTRRKTKLSKSGKELKKLLGKAVGLNESDSEDDDEDDDMDDEIGLSLVLAPKQKHALKEEPVDNSLSKTRVAGSSRGTPQPKSSKGKRKASGNDVKTSHSTPAKKVKTDHEVRAVLLQMAPVTTQELVAKFKASQSGISIP